MGRIITPRAGAQEDMQAAGPGPDDPRDEAVSNDPPDLLAALVSERDQLAADKAELQDRYLRLQAEFQNSRKRAEQSRAEFAEYAATEAVRALLQILDDFERALKIGRPPARNTPRAWS